MSVSIYKNDGSLDPVAATFYRTFACTKAYFDANKNTIPDGTIVFITDDTDEQIGEITNRNVRIYTDSADLPTSGLGIQPDTYAWCINQHTFYKAEWDDQSQKTVKWTAVITNLITEVVQMTTANRYVTGIKNTNGRVEVTTGDTTAAVTAGSNALVTSGAVASAIATEATNRGTAITNAINALDVTDTAVAGRYVSAVSETNGKITVTRANLPAVPSMVLTGTTLTITL